MLTVNKDYQINRAALGMPVSCVVISRSSNICRE